MTNYQTLPPSVLAKVATLEHGCLTLTGKLESSRRDLQRLQVERRECVPQTVGDEWQANRESERVLAEWQRLDDAINAQAATCERLERRLRAEERTVAACKRFLHELPVTARLRLVEGEAGDLDEIRLALKAVADEVGAVQRIPVPSADLVDRIRRYVDELASRARPVIQGIGDGQSLRVLWALTPDANRISLSGFSEAEGNALLLLALVQPENLAERLTKVALDGSISSGERDQRLRALRLEETRLRYDEEASVCAAGGDVARSGNMPAWAVLMVQIEHELVAAA